MIECSILHILILSFFFLFRHASQVGRQLAQIGDDLNERYATQFRDMVRILHITPDTAYEAFAGVARK